MADAAEDFGLIESLLYSNGYQRLERHLRRLRTAAAALGFPVSEPKVMELLNEQAASLDGHDYKVRLLLERDGTVWISAEKVVSPDAPLSVMIADVRVPSHDRLARYKTTRRTIFEQHALPVRELGLTDVLFLNERGELTEAANSNVFVEAGGELLTPPLSAGLLPGVYREMVLETSPNAREAMLTTGDLRQATAVFLCNSVRGWRQVTVRPGLLRL